MVMAKGSQTISPVRRYFFTRTEFRPLAELPGLALKEKPQALRSCLGLQWRAQSVLPHWLGP